MSKPHQLSAQLLALGAALLLLAGCSGTSGTTASTSSATATITSSATATITSSPTTSHPTMTSPQSTAAPAACTAADAFAKALTSFKDSLKTGVTVEQIRAARDRVIKTYDDLVTAVGNAAKARLDAVKSAADRFVSAVNDIPDNATLAQAIDSLRQEAKDVQAALSDLVTEVQC